MPNSYPRSTAIAAQVGVSDQGVNALGTDSLRSNFPCNNTVMTSIGHAIDYINNAVRSLPSASASILIGLHPHHIALPDISNATLDVALTERPLPIFHSAIWQATDQAPILDAATWLRILIESRSVVSRLTKEHFHWLPQQNKNQ